VSASQARRARSRYLPAEDTRLLREAVRGFSGARCLEIGFGSGAVVEDAASRFRLAVGTDTMEMDAAAMVRDERFEAVLADGATCFRDGVFDLVFFNPPYLPSLGIKDPAVDGGRGGIEVAASFLPDAVRTTKRGGDIVLVLSEESDVEGLVERCGDLGLEAREVARKGLFYEDLVVLWLRRKTPG